MNCECDAMFPVGSRRHAICTGDALDTPLSKINTYRRSWGLDPLPDDGRERPQAVVHNGKTKSRPKTKTKAAPSRSCPTCDGKTSRSSSNLSQEVTSGPGSELLFHYQEMGVPSCPACKALADKMDRLGPDECEKQIDELAADILPRARGYADKYNLGKVVPDAVLKWQIRRDLRKAIADSRQPPEWQSVDCSKLLAETEIVVKSFKRHNLLKRFVESVRKFYPTLPIRVVDDSGKLGADAEAVQRMPLVTWHDMPFDSGLTAGRNLGVRESSAKYILLCDDDYEFTKQTQIETLLLGLTETDLDICGGLVQWSGRGPQNWCGNLAFKGTEKRRWLQMTRCSGIFERHRGVRIQRCNVTYNFFACRREFLLEHPWDEQFKITNEHIDSFTAWWQAGAKVGFTVDCIVNHAKATASREYLAKRRRNMSKQFLKKWDIKEKRTIGVTSFKVRK